MRLRASVVGLFVVVLGLAGCGGGGGGTINTSTGGGTTNGGTTAGSTTGGTTSGTLAAATPDSTVTKQTGAVEGQVLDANGNPAGGAAVTVVSATTASRHRGRAAGKSRQAGDSFTTTTDGQGWFHAGNLPPGHYVVTIQVQGATPTVFETDVAPSLVTTTDNVVTTPATSGPSTTTGRIGGAVKATNGSPISAAHVAVVETSTGADTNANGYYQLSDLPAGDYHVTCTAGGYQDATPAAVHLDAGTIKLLVFVLKPTAATAGKIHGWVRDSSSAALANATVMAQATGASVVAHTDASGAYSFDGLSPGSYNVKAGLAEYTPGQAAVAVTAGQDTEQNFTLDKAAATLGGLAGVIKSSDGNVLGGATVITNVGGKNVTATSNSDGKYQLPGLPAGTYRVYCTADGFQPTAQDGVAVTAAQATALNFALTAATAQVGVLEGAVKDGGGQPLGGAKVRASLNGQNNDTTTGTDGRYRLANLAPGKYALAAAKDGYGPATGDATVTAGRSVTRDFTLTAIQTVGRLVGTVKDSNGQPLAGASVGVQYGSVTKYGSTATDGSYTLDNLPAGHYHVAAGKKGYVTAGVDDVVITAGQSTNQDLVLAADTSTGTGKITGVVKLSDGTLVSGASVSVGLTGGTPKYAQTDAHGAFVVDGLPAGTYLVYAGKKPYAVARQDGVVLATGATVTLTMTLGAPSGDANNGTVAGTIQNTDTSPVAAGRAYVTQGTTVIGSATADSNGHYSVIVPAGTYSVTADMFPLTPQTVNNVVVTAGQTTTQNFTLVKPTTGTGKVSGVVKLSDGTLVAGASVSCGQPGSTPVYATTDANGAFSFTNLAPGLYTVYGGKVPYAPVKLEKIPVSNTSALQLTLTLSTGTT